MVPERSSFLFYIKYKMFTVTFSESQKQTLEAIIDTFVAPLDANEESNLIETILNVPGSSSCFTKEQLSQFAKTSGSSIQVVDKIARKIPYILSPKQLNDLLLFINLLSCRPTSILLTGHWKHFKDLQRQERELVFVKWKKSSFAVFKQAYNAFMGLSLTEAYFSLDTPLYEGLHYAEIDGGYKYFKQQSDYEQIKHERLEMITTEDALNLGTKTTFDVIIVGSGAGGGVVAAELAQSGFSVLVIEKGRYFHQDDMVPDNDQNSFLNMFENGGIAPNSTGTVNLLSGSTFGGGTTINYLASLEVYCKINNVFSSKSNRFV